MFNSLKYAKILEDAGLPRSQVETHNQIISEVLEEELATKRDIERLEDKIEKLEYKLVFKPGSLMVILFGSAIGVVSLVL